MKRQTRSQNSRIQTPTHTVEADIQRVVQDTKRKQAKQKQSKKYLFFSLQDCEIFVMPSFCTLNVEIPDKLEQVESSTDGVEAMLNDEIDKYARKKDFHLYL